MQAIAGNSRVNCHLLAPYALYALFFFRLSASISKEGELLSEVWRYQPELPLSLLSQSVGLQGDKQRLERVVNKLINGEPVQMALLGGSLSLRGWNFPDESYIRQLHKWLELTFVPGCRNEAAKRLTHEAASPSPPQWKGKLDFRTSKKLREGAVKGQAVRSRPSVETSLPQVHPSVHGGHQSTEGPIASSLYPKPLMNTTGTEDLDAMWPAEDEWIPARGPGPSSEIHTLPSAGYRGGVLGQDPIPHDGGASVGSSVPSTRRGHMCRDSNVDLVVLAVPAAGPGYTERCVLSQMPEGVDLVILDFGINDYQSGEKLDHPERRALERIIRKILSLPEHPAVIMFEAWSAYQANGAFAGSGKDGKGLKIENLPQDRHVTIAEYYGEIQVVSARAALWQLMKASEDDGNLLIFLGRHFSNDMIHVTPFGHRWYADLLINYLREITTVVLTRQIAAQTLGSTFPSQLQHKSRQSGISTNPAATSQFNRPDSGSRSTHAHSIMSCWSGTASDASGGSGNCTIPGNMGKSYSVLSTPLGLKPPLFSNNEYEDSGVCAIGESFAALVSVSDGWLWLDEGSSGRPKWGFASEQVGKPLTIQLDISKFEQSQRVAISGNVPQPVKPLVAMLIYLSSWKDMGIANITCSERCFCSTSQVNGMSKEKRFRASVPALHKFNVLPKGLFERAPDTDAQFQVEGSAASSKPSICQISVEILQMTFPFFPN
ncbi:hypothetical protein CEUSTIGMA_g929.t1 [Chlamydomonas eustigma]|uniref:SGNH hydrolase-type esterase domain-containing protein n=1 Tax=Chlamydomonas eustigma TaxID=1157962 RepID=A0A250WRK2_9CHLO|nr:hypothetical protein CEUSTIGMA_g929.t1 [Chlamydomonas eustigma]|eukprot:GAX73477.1 hypothetical protein CEUSTIGMA_g929.t1 [Chlamydomonas eustigma]